MKKLLSLALIALFTTFYSCSSDSDSDNNNPSATGNITAKINGQDWASMTGGAVASVMDNSGIGGPTMLQIVGMKADNTSVTIQFPISSLAEGTYTFSGWDSVGSLSYMAGFSGMFSSNEDNGTFTLEITEVNLETNKLSGTFSGTLVDFDGETTMSITNGHIDNVLIVGSSFHSNGSMTLSRNGGAAFTMDANNEDGKFVMLSENTINDNFAIMGYNTNMTADFGIYTLAFPKTITPGTYTLTDDGTYIAGVGNSDGQDAFYLTSGTMTVTSHNGNNVIGTFSFNATNGSQNVAITNGAFNVTHN